MTNSRFWLKGSEGEERIYGGQNMHGTLELTTFQSSLLNGTDN